MYKELFVLIVFSASFSRTSGYTLTIDRELKNGKVLPVWDRSTIEVDGICSRESEGLVSISVALTDSVFYRLQRISVFIANESHQFLKVTFDKIIRVTFYRGPYDVEREISGPEIFVTPSSRTFKVACRFTNSWLPENSSRLSGALEFLDGTIYNSYGIKNHEISIPDIMLLEEYPKITCKH